MRRVIFNQKGGVGKSTITCNLASMNATEMKKTLVIDLDIQGNSTHYILGHKVEQSENTIAQFFKDTLGVSLFGSGIESLEKFIHPSPFPNLFVIPSHPEMDALQSRLESRHKIYKLKEALDNLKGFDQIYIDTPPVLNFYSMSALIAADKCLIPFDCDSFARDSLYTLMRTIQEVQADHNKGLQVEGVIVNQFQKQASLPQRLVNELVEEGVPVLNTKLSTSVKIKESHAESKPLPYFAPYHKATEEFKSLYREINKDA